MKKVTPWMIAAAAVLIAVWAVGSRQSVLRRTCDKIEKQEDRILCLTLQRRQDEELRSTHAAAQRTIAQQEKRLHEIYKHLHRFAVGTNAIPEYPRMTMVVTRSIGHSAEVRIMLTHGGGRGQWLPSAYTVSFLNDDGFVTGHINSGTYDTRLAAGETLTHDYKVDFEFGTPAYFTFDRRRQGSFCP